MEELPSISWSFWTMPRRAIRETLFNMVYGVKVVLQAEIEVETARVLAYTPKGSAVARVEELNLMKKKRIQAFYRME